MSAHTKGLGVEDRGEGFAVMRGDFETVAARIPEEDLARKFAAAPELLEALEDLVLDAIGRGAKEDPLIRKAQAALRKALGKTP